MSSIAGKAARQQQQQKRMQEANAAFYLYRRIDDQLNILRGIAHDYLFLTIQAFVIVGQCLIIQYGGLAFKTVPLSMNQWICTVAIGSLSIPAGILIRLLPPDIPWFWINGNNDEEFKHTVSYARLRWESAMDYAFELVREKKRSRVEEEDAAAAYALITGDPRYSL